MSMNASEIKSIARTNTVALLSDVFEANEAVQFADFLQSGLIALSAKNGRPKRK